MKIINIFTSILINVIINYLFTTFGTGGSVFFNFSNNEIAGVFVIEDVANVFFLVHCLN